MRAVRALATVGSLALLVWLITFPWYGNPKSHSIRTACLSNLKQQATAFLIYQSDFDDRYPTNRAWMDVLKSYVRDERIFHDPGPGWESRYLYAFNAALFGRRTPATSETMPLVYDSTSLARNASNAVTSLPHAGRHSGKNNIAYADGHAKAVAP